MLGNSLDRVSDESIQVRSHGKNANSVLTSAGNV